MIYITAGIVIVAALVVLLVVRGRNKRKQIETIGLIDQRGAGLDLSWKQAHGDKEVKQRLALTKGERRRRWNHRRAGRTI